MNPNVNRAVLAVAMFLALSSVSPTMAASRAYSNAEIEAVQTESEAKVRDLREKEIREFKIALGLRMPENRRADLYLRLAELYFDAYRTEFLLEGRAHEKRLEKETGDKLIDRTRSRPFLKEGIKACEAVLSLGLRYSQVDQVYYFLGFNYGELGDRAKSLKYFDLLTQKFPRSPLVSEAYRALGDAAFDSKNFRKAQGYYELAAKSQSGNSYPRVLHRLAWTYYRLKRSEKAVETMKEAISAASKSGERFLSLKEEALRDMAVFMTESGKAEEALSYFKSVAGDQDFYPRTLERLGKNYERNVEPLKAIQVYEMLLKTHPNDEAAFRVRAKLVDLELRRGRYNEAAARVRGGVFNKDLLKGKGEGDTQTAAQNLRAMIRRTATEHHEVFRKKGDKQALAVAESFYTLYLEEILEIDDSRKESPEIKMYLADVKRELGKAKEASALYRKVIDSGDARYAKEAGALWTASLADAIKKTGATPGAQEPSQLEKEFVEAADELQDALGETAEGREAALKAAQVLAGYPSTRKDARKRADRLVSKSPKSTQGHLAARLWLQSLADELPTQLASVQKSDVADDILDVIGELRANTALMAYDHESGGNSLRDFMTGLEGRLRVSIIASQEQNKDFEAAGKSYEAFAQDSTQQEVAEKAYANAASSYLKSRMFDGAERVIQNWTRRYSNSKRPYDAIRSTATAELIGGSYSQSAALFEKLGRETGDEASLAAAAKIYEGSGQSGKAQQAWAAFLGQFPKSAAKWDIVRDLASSYEREGRDGEAAKAYRMGMSGPSDVQAECGARLGDLYARARDSAQSRGFYEKVAAMPIQGAISPFQGYARYKIAELKEQGVTFSPLSEKEADLRRGLNERQAFVKTVSEAYGRAIEAGGPWGIAGLDRLAVRLWEFADEFQKIPAPDALIDAFRKRALENWTRAYQRAVADQTLSPALPLIGARLADAKIQKMGHAQGVRPRLRIAGLSADGGRDGASAALEKIRDRLTANTKDAAAWVDYGNLLWGEGKPYLARTAYEQALSIDGRSASALNNRGVVALSLGKPEDPFVAFEALALFSAALRTDDLQLAAKQNKAALLNYYRVFKPAVALWEQVNAKAASVDSWDGLGTAQQGLGAFGEAEKSIAKAGDLGAGDKRFSRLFHEAGRSKSGADCVSRLEDLDIESLSPFEKESAQDLMRRCQSWSK